MYNVSFECFVMTLFLKTFLEIFILQSRGCLIPYVLEPHRKKFMGFRYMSYDHVTIIDLSWFSSYFMCRWSIHVCRPRVQTAAIFLQYNVNTLIYIYFIHELKRKQFWIGIRGVNNIMSYILPRIDSNSVINEVIKKANVIQNYNL